MPHATLLLSLANPRRPAPASTDLRLCRHKRPCLVYAKDALPNVDGCMLLKDGTRCIRFRSISSVNAPLWRALKAFPAFHQ